MSKPTPEAVAEMLRRYRERLPALCATFRREDFANRRIYKAKRGWARMRLKKKIWKELALEKKLSTLSSNKLLTHK